MAKNDNSNSKVSADKNKAGRDVNIAINSNEGELNKIVELSKQLGIAENALSSFYKNIGETKKPPEEWGKDLSDFVAKFKEVQAELESQKQKTSNKHNKTHISEIQKAFNNGDIDKADRLMMKDLENQDDIENDREFYDRKIEKASLFEMAAKIKELKFDYEGALKFSKKALDILENHLPNLEKTHDIQEKIIMLLDIAGLSNFELFLYDEAEKFLEKAYNLAKDFLPYHSPHFFRSFHSFAVACSMVGKDNKAEMVLNEYIDIATEHGFENRVLAAQMLNLLALTYMRQHKNKEAKDTLEKSLAILKKHHATEDFLFLGCFVALGTLHIHLKHYTKSEFFFKKAIEIAKDSFGENDIQVASVLTNLAAMYTVQGKYTRAEIKFNEALAMIPENIRDKHSLASDILYGLTEIELRKQQKSINKRQGRGKNR